jgi:hypothetical protein
MNPLDIVRSAYVRYFVIPRMHRHYAKLPATEVFSEVYARSQWGPEAVFDSGPGSSGPSASIYCDQVNRFIQSHSEIQTVVDIGCGDYRVGAQLKAAGKYIGIDVVPELIERNQREYASETVRFTCADAAKDALPDGDLCLIRQVLQHLNNAQIQAILTTCRKYPYVIIAEEVPLKACVPNIDKPHGPDTRIHKHSGVFPEFEPFSVANATLLFTVPLSDDSILRTIYLKKSDT